VKEQFGGTAGNIAYNLSLLGEQPLILATAGTDFGSYENWLKGLGLPTNGIRRIPEEFTAGAYITTDQSDNQITGFNPGAMKYPSLFDMDSVDPADTLAITAPGNVEDMTGYAKAYKERSIRYIFDPGQQLPVLSGEDQKQAISGAWMLISNDYELEMIMRATGLDKNELLQKTGIIITTLGDRGAVVSTPTDQTHIPASRAAQVKDPTGAGDAFRSGLIKGLAMGKNLEVSARMGAVAASFNVECQGTQCHRFTLEDYWARYEANYGPVS